MTFFENAREGKNHWLLYVALIMIGYFLCQIPSTIYLVAIFTGDILSHNREGFEEKLQNLDSLFASTIPGFVVIMLTFLIWMAATWLFFKMLHKRERMTLISGEKTFRKSYFFWGTLIYALFTILIPVFDMITAPDSYTVNSPDSQFYLLLSLAVVLTPFQTGCEELIFRGYLMQGFGLCTKSKFWALIITSVMFGLLHSLNNEVIEYGFWKAIPIYVMVGLQLGFFAILCDGIEFSWGIHFINNLICFVLFSNEGGTMSEFAFIQFKREAVTVTDYIFPIATTALIYLIFRKKMGWDLRKAFDNSGLKPISASVTPPSTSTPEM